MRFGRLVVALMVGAAGLPAAPTRTIADETFGGVTHETSEAQTSGQQFAEYQPAAVGSPQDAATISPAAVERIPTEDFDYDPLILKGPARGVCAGRLLTGSGWAYSEIVGRFGGSPGTLYSCRERWDVLNNPDCNGTVTNPLFNPNYFSTCWSNHARGRAIDIMVGRVSGGYNQYRGMSIVNWLLAPDSAGNVSANARALGIQQILFANRCWNSDGDRGITSWYDMRECGIGHFDHVHIDLTIRGANGTVSYWGTTPQVEAKLDSQVFWDRNSAYRQAISWWNLTASDEEGLAVPAQYDQMIGGDFDGDGLQDETFLWDDQTGNWAVQNWNDGDALTASIYDWDAKFDQFIVGDWDADGAVDDMFIWDSSAGEVQIQAWTSSYTPRYRGSGYWSPRYEQVIGGDFDGNGYLNDIMFWDRDTGEWAVYSWASFRATYRSSGYWGRSYDNMTVGDWSAGGDLDDIIVWDHDTGRWLLYTWVDFRPIRIRDGYWSSTIDIAAPGDYDGDGRTDDLFLYDAGTGRWLLWSFHRNVPSTRLTGTWARGYDVVTVGSFMD